MTQAKNAYEDYQENKNNTIRRFENKKHVKFNWEYIPNKVTGKHRDLERNFEESLK